MRPWAFVALLALGAAAAAATTLARPDRRGWPNLDQQQQQPDADQLEDYDDESQSQATATTTTRRETPACGQAPKAGGASRIVDGLDQKYGEFPSFVSLVRSDGNIACGGTLISARHVLTAAHCLNWTDSARHWHALLGPEMPYEGFFDGAVAIKERACVGHYDHHRRALRDWAVLELAQEVDIGRDYVRAACLPSSDSPRVRHGPDTECWLVGAGTYLLELDENNKLGEHAPRKVQKLRVEQQACTWQMNYTLHPSQLCYGATNPRHRGGLCGGDSGGPVLCRDQEPPRWTLTAVAKGHHHDPKNARCNSGPRDRQYPAVATDVWSILDDMRRDCAWMGVP